MNDRAASRNEKTADLGHTQLDLDRQRRCGFSEVIFGEAKSVDALVRIVERLLAAGQPVLATRLDAEKGSRLAEHFPTGRYHPTGRTFRIDAAGDHVRRGRVAVVAAGTSDLPVAEEARETIEWMGVEAELVVDVGVAGPQRLAENLPRIVGSDAVVVVAGMEAALASVLGGHVDCPVIAVPTSVGYGANFGGLAALLGMINSCAANVSVVNIDAGFKAGYIAGMIAARAHRPAGQEASHVRSAAHQ
ncbi:MAG: nickel pincer cofactor biosynthesis protein LarB [Pirellulaceae bacterium]|jgi:hypothetical protein|nr:nickel pincer cofactor biosynthesis protein LarB [Pirellulaceae bacterium]